MIHLRVSSLEQYRRVVETAFGDESELLAYVSNGQEGEANWKMAAGTAWHRVLQTNGEDWTGGNFIRCGDFSFGCVKAINEAIHHVGPGLCEITAKRTFRVGRNDVLLQGTCDRIRGLTIRDAKCKWSPVDPMDYAPSLQWKAYTVLFQTEIFVYDLFSFKDPTESGYCELKAIDSFRFFRYKGIEDEVETWLRRFVHWAEEKNLISCLQGEKEFAR